MRLQVLDCVRLNVDWRLRLAGLIALELLTQLLEGPALLLRGELPNLFAGTGHAGEKTLQIELMPLGLLQWRESLGPPAAGLTQTMACLDRGRQRRRHLPWVCAGVCGRRAQPLQGAAGGLLQGTTSSRLPFQGLSQLEITCHQGIGAVLAQGPLQGAARGSSDLRC